MLQRYANWCNTSGKINLHWGIPCSGLPSVARLCYNHYHLLYRNTMLVNFKILTDNLIINPITTVSLTYWGMHIIQHLLPYSRRFLGIPNKQRKKEKKRCLLATARYCAQPFPTLLMCALVYVQMCARKSSQQKAVFCFHAGLTSCSVLCGDYFSSFVLGLCWRHPPDGGELHPLHQSTWWGIFSMGALAYFCIQTCCIV